ncbi:MAG: HAD hydrolase-like protein, partial [Gammaproteobacteria bacterium]|nr:HAD hydrolase-like protein [Gammaproteobacteria bacterium]
MKLMPKDCAFIGDHERDIIAGRAAGLYTVVASYGYIPDHHQPSTWGADANIEDIESIYSLIS